MPYQIICEYDPATATNVVVHTRGCPAFSCQYILSSSTCVTKRTRICLFFSPTYTEVGGFIVVHCKHTCNSRCAISRPTSFLVKCLPFTAAAIGARVSLTRKAETELLADWNCSCSSMILDSSALHVRACHNHILPAKNVMLQQVRCFRRECDYFSQQREGADLYDVNFQWVTKNHASVTPPPTVESLGRRVFWGRFAVGLHCKQANTTGKKMRVLDYGVNEGLRASNRVRTNTSHSLVFVHEVFRLFLAQISVGE